MMLYAISPGSGAANTADSKSASPGFESQSGEFGCMVESGLIHQPAKLATGNSRPVVQIHLHPLKGLISNFFK